MPEAAKIIEQKKEFTYKDYLEFDDDVRVELIDGKVWDMSPAPTTIHQIICQNMAVELGIFLETGIVRHLYVQQM